MSTLLPSYHSCFGADIDPYARLWVLRILVRLGGYTEFVRYHRVTHDEIAKFLDLEHWLDQEDGSVSIDMFTELRNLLEAQEQMLEGRFVADPLFSNVRRLADLAGLNETDCRILEILALVNVEAALEEACRLAGSMSSGRASTFLAKLLAIPEPRIRESISNTSPLLKSGLVSIASNGSGYLSCKLELLSPSFADKLVCCDSDPISLVRDIVFPSSPPHLTLNHYSHLHRELGILRPYLRHAVATGRRGVNILFHGAAGTGKSQLTKVLSRELQCKLFEVASEDAQGDAISGAKRLRAFRVAQTLLSTEQSLILFDEVEDVFDDGDFPWGGKSTAQKNKAWINRTLESNPVPSFWLCNGAWGLDPAFVRRFDLIVELPVPPRSQRRNIIRDHCGELLNEQAIDRIASADRLSPAVIARTAAVVTSIRNQLDDQQVSHAFELMVNNTLRTQGHRPIGRTGAVLVPEGYDPVHVNADTDLEGLRRGLQVARAGRLCLYGPPGTGKTAFGSWLADQLDMPLLAKRASDLLGMYVGETERLIADAFSEAELEGAVLLIDEVDSFLQDRRGAERSWEITAVNEMLICMENFQGLFIASTNRIEGLDQASLRRFDVKVCFDYLRPEQAEALFVAHCGLLGVSPPTRVHLGAIRRLRNLTPGDFAALRRQSRFRQLPDPAELLRVLEADCGLKGSNKRPIGFVV